MKTIQMTLDEKLVEEVDAAVEKLGTSRSAFARSALRSALAVLKEKQLEQKHREGYRKKPAGKREFSAWEGEQAWGET